MSGSYQKLSEIFQNLNSDAAVLGFDFLTPNYKLWNMRFIGIVMFMTSYLFVSIYCFKIYSDDLIKFVFCGVTFGFLVKGAIQMYYDFSERYMLVELVNDAGKVFKFASHLGTELDDILVKDCSYLTIVNKMTKLLFYFVGSSTLFYPVVSKIVFDELLLPYGFELPFVEPFSLFGYILNYIYSGMCSVICSFGFVISDSFIVTMIFPIYGMYAALTHLIEGLKQFNDSSNQLTMKQRESMLGDAVKLHQMILNYIDEVSGFFENANFFCINTIVAQCVGSLFAFIVSGWYIGACFVVMNIFQLFIYSILGEILLIMQEGFYTKLTDMHGSTRRKRRKKF